MWKDVEQVELSYTAVEMKGNTTTLDTPIGSFFKLNIYQAIPCLRYFPKRIKNLFTQSLMCECS